VTLSEQQLSDLFVAADMPLHKQTLNAMYKELSKNTTKGVSFDNLL